MLYIEVDSDHEVESNKNHVELNGHKPDTLHFQENFETIGISDISPDTNRD